MNKPRIVEPDPNDPTAAIRHFPDGTIGFTEKGYARWKPRFTKIGIDIHQINTTAEAVEAMFLSAEADPRRAPAESALLAIFETDPALKAQYEREAQPFHDSSARMEKLGLRVIPGGTE